MAIKHVAKYGRVWKRLKDGAILGREIELKDKEKISSYAEVYAQKAEQKPESTKKKDSASFGVLKGE